MGRLSGRNKSPPRPKDWGSLAASVMRWTVAACSLLKEIRVTSFFEMSFLRRASALANKFFGKKINSFVLSILLYKIFCTGASCLKMRYEVMKLAVPKMPWTSFSFILTIFLLFYKMLESYKSIKCWNSAIFSCEIEISTKCLPVL